SALNEFDQAIEKENKQKIYLSLEELINSLNTSNNSIEKLSSNTKQVISIIADIAYCNPKVIPVCCSIISKLFTKLEDSEPIKRLVYNKLIRMPNSGFAQIWMQRMLKSDLNNFNFSEKMCNLYKGEISLWNNDWIICSNMLSILKDTPVFQQDEFSQLSNTMSNDEVYIFDY
ncbi:TPA: cobalt transporter, partial [Haemophilus influenzae]